MAKTVAAAIARVQEVMATVTSDDSSIRSLPEFPPDMIGVYPASVVSVGNAEWHCGAGQREFRGDIIIRLFVPRMTPNLSRAHELLLGYAESMANAFEADNEVTLNGTVEQIDFPIYQDEPVEGVWGTDELVMLRWRMRVIIANAIV